MVQSRGVFGADYLALRELHLMANLAPGGLQVTKRNSLFPI